MDKLKMMSMDKVQGNIEKIRALFPNAVTEVLRDGKPTLAVDFDVLKQELADDLIDARELRYQFTWPDKQKSILLANTPISKTLRPCKEESVDFDNTQNLYIEGDNLEVLKLLQETYLGKIKMIYIDPPYNTGNDFVYNDDFSKETSEYIGSSGQFDEEGNNTTKSLMENWKQNFESNGRFHTDWLNMIYPRLRLAKDLLSDDGVIFISIDDNEVDNLRKVCDEVFGEQNFEAAIKWRRRSNQPNDATKMIATVSEYIIVYAKNSNILKETKQFGTIELSDERLAAYTNPDNDPKGAWSTTPWCASKGQGGSRYTITTPTGVTYDEVWLGTQDTFDKLLKDGRIIFTSNGHGKPRKKVYKSEAIAKGQAAIDFCVGERYGDNLEATNDMKKVFELDRVFDYSKPLKLIKLFIRLGCPQRGIILDFFSGSATTAHAVMQLNAEDGGNRKFIMVQLPEPCDEKSEAYKAGYKNICEIGKERIRRAGKKIKEENGEKAQGLDIGFRVFQLDSSNMKDIYYKPEEYSQILLGNMQDNIKPERTAFDLLFQVMLELGKPLSAKITQRVIAGKSVLNVDDGDLIACFEDNITAEIVTEIAKAKPLYAVFRDSGLSSDSVAANFEQIFATCSPNTIRKVL